MRFLSLVLFCVLLKGASLYAQSGIQQIDNNILEKLAAGRTPGQTSFWYGISHVNNYVNIGVPAGLLVAGLIRNDEPMKENALYVASSTASSYLLDYLIKIIVRRPRPFIVDLHLTPVYRPGEYSFPSGHTSSSFGTMVALSRAYPKWYVIAPALLWSTSIGYSRLYLGVHNPSDVLAGAALGTGAAFGMGFLKH